MCYIVLYTSTETTMLSPEVQFKKEVKQMVVSTIGLMLIVFILVMLAVPVK